jgi:hypothetical protein
VAKATSRDPRLLAYRVAIVALLLVVTWVAVTATLAGVTRRYRPEATLQFRGSDALAQAQVAAKEQLDNPRRQDENRLRGLAIAALQRDPTLAPAVRVLGLIEATKGRTAAAERLMNYSDRVTRRDLPTQLWLIEYNVQRNNIPATLHHFDIAASSSRGATTILFPILVGALDEDHLVQPMAQMLKREPWWGASLLSAMAQETRNTGNVVRLFTTLARQGHSPRRDIIETLVRRLEAQGDRSGAARMRQLMASAPPPQPRDDLLVDQ